MSSKLRLNVPFLVLFYSVIFIAPASFRVSSRLCSRNQSLIHIVKSPVIHDHTENFVEQCTGFELSHEDSEEMSALNLEQKEVVKNLYKFGRKLVHCESHLDFLEESLKLKFIPRAFQIKTIIPGNQKSIKERLNKVSLESVSDEGWWSPWLILKLTNFYEDLINMFYFCNHNFHLSTEK